MLPEAFHSQLDSSRLRTRYVEVICWSGEIHCEQRGRNFGRHQTKGFRVTLPFSRNLLLPSPNAQRHTNASQFSIARKTLSHRWYIAVCSITHIVGESWRLNRNPGCIPGRKHKARRHLLRRLLLHRNHPGLSEPVWPPRTLC